jgi:hypothetical protein
MGANLIKVSVYQDQMSTAATNKVGMEELEERNALNAVINVLNAEWTSYTPTLTFNQTSVAGLTTVGKYIQVGSTVFFKVQSVRAATTNLITNTTLQISLPVTPADDDSYPPVNALQLLYTSTAYQDPQAFIDMTSTAEAGRVICFRKYDPAKGGSMAYAMYINGFYQASL